MSDSGEPIRFSIPDRPKDDTRKRLGKGLGALLGETRREEPLVVDQSIDSKANSSGTGLANLSVSAIEPLPGVTGLPLVAEKPHLAVGVALAIVPPEGTTILVTLIVLSHWPLARFCRKVASAA